MKLTRPMRRGESGGRLVTTVVAAAAVVSVLSAAESQSRRIQVGTLDTVLTFGQHRADRRFSTQCELFV